MLALGLTACSTETSDDPEPGGGNATSKPKSSDEPKQSDVKAVSTGIIYLPDQVDGNFHNGYAVVENTSSKAAEVSAQLTIRDASGKILKTTNPTPIVVLPKSKGAFVEETGLDLPKPAKGGKIEAALESEFSDAPTKPAVKLSKLKIAKDSLGGCTISGEATNTFKKSRSIEVNVIGYNGGKIVAGGGATIDKAFPGAPSTFEYNEVSPAACPASVERLEAYWDPGFEGL